MLSIERLEKTYPGGVRALKGISLNIDTGMFGLLGPNGAGKTTLMKILATLLESDSGSAVMNGVDLIADKNRARQMLGYLPQEFGLYPTLTAEQTLNYFAKLKGVWNKSDRTALVGALLERVNLSDARQQRVGGFSGGMRQRLGIAQALIGQPALLIVDEPTAGLDPEERVRFHNLISETASKDSVVILSTHIVSDVSNLCSQMAIIRQGEIVVTTSPQEALNQLDGSIWEAMLPREKLQELQAHYQILSAQMFAGQLRVRVVSKGRRPSEDFAGATPNLEDYYLSLLAEK